LNLQFFCIFRLPRRVRLRIVKISRIRSGETHQAKPSVQDMHHRNGMWSSHHRLISNKCDRSVCQYLLRLSQIKSNGDQFMQTILQPLTASTHKT